MGLTNDRIERASIKLPEEIDGTTETNANTYVDVSGKGKNLLMVGHAGLTNAQTAVYQLTQATSTGGAGKKDVSGKTFTLTGGTSKMGEMEFAPTDLDLDNSFFFVGVDITNTGAGDDIEAHLDYIPDFLHGGTNPTN